ncbi:MAG: helix-turn-helix domain-containing protein [Myxococcota bacterium]|jgi:AcrR family transcriptional regulator|nr:hypothetical protein [Deltaproteobacteria bacterium]MCP4241189.1 TetR/AcrR family transcriptional regulator [bacterium]MDP6075099.1 helix-turn-helix domain-containing protein [Myxococcota bacterium]MDP6244714.1 helix-turn-helix domain-containing protein [Myxococcota bacterium]MDP7074791.1 helix-turn-helix domain-containing protein [Myxococcota bacterium]
MPTTASRRRSIDSAATREAILDAAEALFAERGFAGAGMREIAEVSDLTPASLYNHFRSKEALYEAVLARALTPLLEILRDFASRDQSLPAADEMVGAIMARLARTPHVPRLLHHEAASGAERLQHISREWIRPLFEQGISALRRDPINPWGEGEQALVISAWLHMVFGHFALAPLLAEVRGEDPLSPDALERQTHFFRKLARLMMTPRTPSSEPDPTDGV